MQENSVMLRDAIKIIVIAVLAAAATTYVTVQILVKDTARMEVIVERLISRMENFNDRLISMETKANERKPTIDAAAIKIPDLENRVRALEAKK